MCIRDSQSTGYLTNSFYNSSGQSNTSLSDAASLPPTLFPFSPSQSIPPNTLNPMIHALNRSGQSDKLVGCIVGAESSGITTSQQSPPNTARGLMQVTRGAAQDVAGSAPGGAQLYSQLADPAINIATGSAYLNLQVNRYHGGDLQAGLASYGTGPAYASARQACAQKP